MANAHPQARKKALVLGGGFAGVQAAIELRKQNRFEVTLVSDRDYLYLFPISIWVPLRTLSPERARVPLAQISRRHGFATVISPVRGLDAENNTVTLADRVLGYDYLVVALGAGKTSLPGQENTFSLCEAPAAALGIRARIDDLVSRGQGRIAFGFSGNPKDSSAVRGGPVFEFMFNVDHLLRKKDLRERFELTFFAPMPRPGERLGDKAFPRLTSMLTGKGIARRVGTPLRGFDADGVMFGDESRLDADLVVFVPGAAGHPVLESSDLPLNDAGFVHIDKHGLVEGTDNVYAVGDSAALEGPAWRAKQGHVAEVMARVAVHNITMADRGESDRRGYQEHLSVICVLDIGNGAAFVYRGTKRELMIPLPVVGHWMKKGWGWYARATKTGRMPRLPGL